MRDQERSHQSLMHPSPQIDKVPTIASVSMGDEEQDGCTMGRESQGNPFTCGDGSKEQEAMVKTWRITPKLLNQIPRLNIPCKDQAM
jgi:hypothetical protein